jgi:hypothetical protein
MKRLFFALTIPLISLAAAGQIKPADKAETSSAFENYKTKKVPEFAVKVLADMAASGDKSIEALNIRDFSRAMPGGHKVVPDATVSGNEDTARGTNVAPAIIAAINAAAKGQFIIIGPGEWLVSTPIDLPVSKQVNLVCMGTLHFNKRDGFRIKAPVGADPQHHLFFYGSLVGRENMPKHSKATHDAGTQPKWSEMTNTAIDITNCSRNFILINKAEGFGNGVRINGSNGNGSQENTVSFQFLYKNANGITLKSIDGNSYVDKNYFMGFYGGAGRISGGLAVNIDGYEGAAPNGERYNGAFRSNEFHFMIEQVDSIIVANGDVSEPVFDITVEAGVNTGVYGTTGFKMRSVAPNFVRSPKYCGSGIFNTTWLTNGMGVNGTILGMPVYFNNHTLIGTYGKTDASGNLIMETRAPLPKTLKDALPASIKIISVQ